MSILDLVGNTPLVEIHGFDTGVCKLFLKLESQNPGGSIKDRIAISMVDEAEKTGKLKPGGTIVEATAGNTGLGLSLVASQRGYKVLLVMPDKFSREKVSHSRALGATVVRTRSDVIRGHPDYYVDRAETIAKGMPGAWFANQFSNPANAAAHTKSTGPEILKQMNNQLDAVVVGIGSGGTLGGLTKFFQEKSPNVEMVIADPVGSVIVPYIKTGKITEAGSWLVEGIGEDFIPDIADFSLVKTGYTISDKESFSIVRELLRTNGILAGTSSGTLLAAALKYCREQTQPKRVVTFICDGGAKYLSKAFNDFWLLEHGLLETKRHGDLRDLISRHYAQGSVVHVSPNETVNVAHTRMKSSDVSQLPVIESGRVVGIVDESDLLFALHENKAALTLQVKEIMSTQLETVFPSDSIDKVMSIFKKGRVALVADDKEFYGVVTKIDLVDYLRRE